MRIKQLREDLGVTQQAVGDALGITQQAIYNYEKSHREPDINTLKALADYFAVSIDYIVGYSDRRQSTVEYEMYKSTPFEAEIISILRKFPDDYNTILVDLLKKTYAIK